MEAHFRLCVQLALVSNSIFLAVFMAIYLNELKGIETDTIYSSLYQVTHSCSNIVQQAPRRSCDTPRHAVPLLIHATSHRTTALSLSLSLYV